MRTRTTDRPAVNIAIGDHMCRLIDGESAQRKGRLYEASNGERMIARDAETWTAVDRLRLTRFLGEREFAPHLLDGLERQGFSLIRQSGMVGFAEPVAWKGDFVPL